MRKTFASLVVLSMLGCSGLDSGAGNRGADTSEPPPSRYDQEFDTGPNEEVDVDSIAHILPEPVVRTRAGNYSPYTVMGKTYTVLPDSQDFVEEGMASWYGTKFHGQLTSNGEIFDMYGMTAAHKHLPIPTYVEVTNLDNGLKAILRVNDRGPFHGDRVIDLSWGAAAKLGYSDKGTARVRIVALDPNDPQATLANASALASEMGVVPSVPAAIPAEAISSENALPPQSYYQIARLTNKVRAQDLSDELEAYVKFPVVIAEQERQGHMSYLV